MTESDLDAYAMGPAYLWFQWQTLRKIKTQTKEFKFIMKLEVFDPPMCCSSGVCGPETDPELSRFAADLKKLKQRGVQVSRYNLAQEPMAFVQNETVRDLLEEDQECLPLVLINGEVVSRNKYPAAETIAAVVGENMAEDE